MGLVKSDCGLKAIVRGVNSYFLSLNGLTRNLPKMAQLANEEVAADGRRRDREARDLLKKHRKEERAGSALGFATSGGRNAKKEDAKEKPVSKIRLKRDVFAFGCYHSCHSGTHFALFFEF